MKKVKKIVALILAALFLLSGVSVFADGGDFKIAWYVDGNQVTETTHSDGTDPSAVEPPVIIPSPDDTFFGYSISWGTPYKVNDTDYAIDGSTDYNNPVSVNVIYMSEGVNPFVPSETLSGTFENTVGDYSVTGIYGEEIPAPAQFTAPERFKHSGWQYTDGNGDNYTVDNIADLPWIYSGDYSFQITQNGEYNIYLTPLFDGADNGTAYFHANGGRFPDGSETKTVSQTYYQRTRQPAVYPKKTVGSSECVFLGWNTNSDAESAAELPVFTDTADYYAIYDDISITVSWVVNDTTVKTYSDAPIINGLTDMAPTLEEALSEFTEQDREKYRQGYTLTWEETESASVDTVIHGTLTPNKYNVFYFVNGKRYSSEIRTYDTLIYNTSIDPSSEDTLFDGWYYDADMTRKAGDSFRMPAEDLYLYGKHTAELIFILDGETFSDEWIPVGEAISAKEVPDRRGYEFKGWSDIPSTMPEATTVINGSYEIIKIRAVFTLGTGRNSGAKWKDGGTGDLSYTVPFDYSISEPDTPEWENHTFLGWDIDVPEKAGTESFTANALWKSDIPPEKISIVYRHTDSTEEIVSGFAGEAVTAPEFNSSDYPSGFTPSWSEAYSVFPEDEPSKPVTVILTAEKITVSFVRNEGTDEITEIETVFNAMLAKPAVPVRQGVNFAAWYKNDGTQFDFSKTIEENLDGNYQGALTLTAKYTVRDTYYTVTNVKTSDDGTVSFRYIPISDGIFEKMIGEETGNYSVPEVDAPDGFVFFGWADQYNNSVNPDGSFGEVNRDFYATFAFSRYSVRYIVDGKEYASYKLSAGSEIKRPETPKKEADSSGEYIFSGWTPEIPAVMPAEDLIFTGNIVKVPFTVTYILDGEEYAVFNATSGEAVPLPENPPEKSDGKGTYIFNGWDTEIPAVMPAASLEITGHMTYIPLTVTYLLDGKEYAVFNAETGGAVPQPDTPVKADDENGTYEFSGWSPEIPATMPVKPLTFTGQMIFKPYTVTYILDGNEYAVFEVKAGSAVPRPSDPEKEADEAGEYEFSGWSPDIPAVMPAKSLVFSGKTVLIPYNNNDEKTYTLIYNDEDGSRLHCYTGLKEGDAVPSPPAPQKFARRFAGWSPELPQTMPAEDITVTATYVNDCILFSGCDAGTFFSGLIKAVKQITDWLTSLFSPLTVFDR
jgi:hypothetical protein